MHLYLPGLSINMSNDSMISVDIAFALFGVMM